MSASPVRLRYKMRYSQVRWIYAFQRENMLAKSQDKRESLSEDLSRPGLLLTNQTCLFTPFLPPFTLLNNYKMKLHYFVEILPNNYLCLSLFFAFGWCDYIIIKELWKVINHKKCFTLCEDCPGLASQQRQKC